MDEIMVDENVEQVRLVPTDRDDRADPKHSETTTDAENGVSCGDDRSHEHFFYN